MVLGNIIGIQMCGLSLWWLVLIGFIYSLILFYGCYFIQANFFLKVHNKGITSKKIIALTFDDGPDDNTTSKILLILKEKKVKATFFCIGKRIAGNELIIQQMHLDQHLIGNHSYSHHFWFDVFSVNKMLKDLQKTDILINQITGNKPIYFRPPYGVTNPNVAKTIKIGKYIPIGWNVRSMDTISKNPEQLISKLKNAICPGAIILLHDTMNITVSILPLLIEEIKANGYTFVRVDELLNLDIKPT